MTTTRPARTRPAAPPNRATTARTTAPRTATAPAGAGAGAHPADRRGGAALVRVKRLFGAESPNAFLLLGTVLFLVLFGLVMVLSASSITDFKASGDFFTSFSKQGLFALIGIPLMLGVARLPVGFYRSWSPLLLGIALVAQSATIIAGHGDYNKSWLSVGGISFQPAEFTKLALVLALATTLTRGEGALASWRSVVRRVVPISLAAATLVMAGNDLGSALVLVAIVFGAMFFAGAKRAHLAIGGTLTAVAAIIAAIAGSSRLERITIWLHNSCAHPTVELYNKFCWQPQQGTWALAAGGVFGRGLGHSQGKWSYVPESDNDYIFAIIGEELGLIGCVLVLALFVVLAIAFMRILRGTDDPFARTAVGGIMVWLVGQAFMNIGVVLQVVPVLGVPLPLISAGGSALIAALFAIGVALSCARARPRFARPAPLR